MREICEKHNAEINLHFFIYLALQVKLKLYTYNIITFSLCMSRPINKVLTCSGFSLEA